LRTDIGKQFILAYMEMLWAVAGKELKGAAAYVAARDQFFGNDGILKNPPTRDDDLAAALRTAVFGRFVICRHMPEWTEMIGPENRLYRVKGITSELADLVDPWSVADTAVMQFRGEWICDGLVKKLGVEIGPGIRAELMARIRSEQRQMSRCSSRKRRSSR
jgi:hypothetical protein